MAQRQTQRKDPDNVDNQEQAEKLALMLSSHGMQRMTSRVLATMLFTEKPSMTAADLADLLQASAGSISTATKALISVGLVERVPVPSSRRDHYRLRDDAWAIMYTNQNEVITAMQQAADAGVTATTPGGLAHQRLTQMRDFYTFMWEQIPALLQRWQQMHS